MFPFLSVETIAIASFSFTSVIFKLFQYAYIFLLLINQFSCIPREIITSNYANLCFFLSPFFMLLYFQFKTSVSGLKVTFLMFRALLQHNIKLDVKSVVIFFFFFFLISGKASNS